MSQKFLLYLGTYNNLSLAAYNNSSLGTRIIQVYGTGGSKGGHSPPKKSSQLILNLIFTKKFYSVMYQYIEYLINKCTSMKSCNLTSSDIWDFEICMKQKIKAKSMFLAWIINSNIKMKFFFS